MSKGQMALLAGILLVLATSITAVVFNLGGGDTPPPSTAGGDFTEFVAEDAGFAISYPSSWQRVERDDPLLHLLVTPPGERNSLLVRTIPLNVAVTEEQMGGVRSFTRQFVEGGGGSVEILRGPLQLQLGELPGWYYLYRFADQQTGQIGAHSHYFLFHGDQMIVIVLQALPASEFQQLGEIFDRITASFRVLDG